MVTTTMSSLTRTNNKLLDPRTLYNNYIIVPFTTNCKPP